MRAKFEKFGDDVVVLIPEPILAKIGARVGDHMNVHVEAGRIVIGLAGNNPSDSFNRGPAA